MLLGTGALGLWLGHEGSAFKNKINVLIKEILETSYAPFTMQGYKKKTAEYEPGSRLSPDN